MNYARFPASAIGPHATPDVFADFGGLLFRGERARTKNGILVPQMGWGRLADPVLVNGNFASGVTGWQTGAAAISQQLATPRPGYSGRVVASAGYGYAYQPGITTTGAVYHLKGHTRTQSGNPVYWTNSAGPALAGGTFASVNWQDFDYTGQLGTTFLLMVRDSGAWGEWADIVIKSLSMNLIRPEVDAGIFKDIYLQQTTAANMPWDALVAGRHGINFGSAVTDRRAANFSTLVPQVAGQTIYLVLNKKVASVAPKLILNRLVYDSPALWLGATAADVMCVQTNSGFYCLQTFANGVNVVRLRLTASMIGLRVGTAAETTYSVVPPVLSTWHSLGHATQDWGPCSDYLAVGFINKDMPTEYPAVDFAIRRNLALDFGAPVPTS